MTRLTVSLSSVRFHATHVGSKGLSPGDGFQESWLPNHPGAARRQDAVAIATFQQGVFLGTVTFKDGQIVYTGSTNNQDNATYAIIGGTGTDQGARGTLSTHSLPHGRLQITITTEGSYIQTNTRLPPRCGRRICLPGSTSQEECPPSESRGNRSKVVPVRIGRRGVQKGRKMMSALLDAAGHRRSPTTMPGYREGQAPRNKGLRYPADPPMVEEIVAVMRCG